MAQRSVAEKLALLDQHDDDAPWARIAAESGVPLRTLSRWSAKYRADPTSHGLERSRRSDHAGRRIPAELIEAIEALALRRPEPTAAFIHRRVGDIATDRGLTAPSYSSVRAIIGAIDPGLRTLAQNGDALGIGNLSPNTPSPRVLCGTVQNGSRLHGTKKHPLPLVL